MSFQANPNDSFAPNNPSIIIPPSTGQSKRDRSKCCAETMLKLLNTLEEIDRNCDLPILPIDTSIFGRAYEIPFECIDTFGSNACSDKCINWLYQVRNTILRYLERVRLGEISTNCDLQKALDAIEKVLFNPNSCLFDGSLNPNQTFNPNDFADNDGQSISTDAPARYRSITPETLPDGLSVINVIEVTNPNAITPTSDRVVPLGWDFRPEIYVREQVVKCCAELQRIKDAYRNNNPPIEGLQELDSNDCDFLDQVQSIVNRNPNGLAEGQLARMMRNCITLWQWWTQQLLESGDPELPNQPGLQVSPLVDRYNKFLKELKEWWDTPEEQRNPKCPRGGVVHPSDIENGVVPYLPPPGYGPGMTLCDYTYCYALNGAADHDGPHGPLMPIFSQAWWQWWNTRQRDGKSLPVLNPKFMKKLLRSYPQFLGISCRLGGVLEFNPEQPCSVPADAGLFPTPGPNRLIAPGYGGSQDCSFYPHLFPSDGQDLAKDCMKVVIYYGGQQKVICVCKDGSPNPQTPGDPQLWREFAPPLPPIPDDGTEPVWAPEGCKCIDSPSPFPGVLGGRCPEPPTGYRSAINPQPSDVLKPAEVSFVDANAIQFFNSIAYISSDLWKSRQSRKKACNALTKAGELYTQYNTLLPSGIKSWPFNYSDKKFAGECSFNPPINGYDGVPLFNYGVDCVGGITDPRSHIKTIVDWIKCHRDAAANKKGVGGNIGRWNHILKQFEDFYNEGEGSSFIYRMASDASLVEYTSPADPQLGVDEVLTAVAQNCNSVLQRRLSTLSYRLAVIKCLMKNCYNLYYFSDCDENGQCTTRRDFQRMSVVERNNIEIGLASCLQEVSGLLYTLGLPGDRSKLGELVRRLLQTFNFNPNLRETSYNCGGGVAPDLPCARDSHSESPFDPTPQSTNEWLDTIFGIILPMLISNLMLKSPCALLNILKSDEWNGRGVLGLSGATGGFLRQRIRGCLAESGYEWTDSGAPSSSNPNNPYNLRPDQPMPAAPQACIDRMEELCDNFKEHPTKIDKILECALNKLFIPANVKLCPKDFLRCEDGVLRHKSIEEIKQVLDEILKKLLQECCEDFARISTFRRSPCCGYEDPPCSRTGFCIESGCVDNPDTPAISEDEVNCSVIVNYLLGDTSTILPDCFRCEGRRKLGFRAASDSDSQDGGLPDPDTSGPGGPVVSDDAICGELIISTTIDVENGLRRLRASQPIFLSCDAALAAVHRTQLHYPNENVLNVTIRHWRKQLIQCYIEDLEKGVLSAECYRIMQILKRLIEDFLNEFGAGGLFAIERQKVRDNATYVLEALKYLEENCITQVGSPLPGPEDTPYPLRDPLF